MVIITIGFFGGLIYLIYLPFKKRLVKSGKLTDKQSVRINRILIFILCLFAFILYCFKDYRTPSKDRLEEISDIKLPPDFKVLKDEYQDMGPDYCISYDIKFDNNFTKELISLIKKSKFYKTKSFNNIVQKENDFNRVDSVKAIWFKSPTGYNFSKNERLTYYHIELDTIKNILKYNECAD